MGSHSKDEIVAALVRSTHSESDREANTSNDQSENVESRPAVTSAGRSSTIQSQLGLQNVMGYVDNSALQLLTVNQSSGRQGGSNPLLLQQASSIQSCSVQQTSLVQPSIRPSDDSQQQSRPAASPVPPGPGRGTLQIRRTLNNVQIVNNLGTNIQPRAPGQSVENSNIVNNGASILIPSVNLGLVGGSLVPFNMMGGMASTPLLLPQVNGPTLLVNVPNYTAYQGVTNVPGLPGVFMPNVLGSGIATLGSVASVMVTCQQNTNTTTTTPSSLSTSSTSVVTTNQSLIMSSQTPISSKTDMSTGCHDNSISDSSMEILEQTVSGPRASTPIPPKPQRDTPEIICEDEDINLMNSSAHDIELNEEENINPEELSISRSETSSLTALFSPPQSRSRHQSVISHGHTNSKMPESTNQISAIISPRSVGTIQDTLLASTADQSDVTAQSSTSRQDTESFSVDNPQLPQLTLNFPSILMMDSQAQSPPMPRSSSSSVIVSHNSDLPSSQSQAASFSMTGQQPITVDTVEALQTALACDNDVQLVVSNELLETPEFKALMQNMDQSNTLASSLQSTPAVSPRPQDRVDEDSNMARPSAILEESNPPSPIPCSSGEMSREATSFQNTTDDILAIHPGSDDEMTLQDLIAVETIDESQMEEEDMHWSSQLSFDSFNYISQLTNFTDNKKPAIEFNSKNAGKSKKGSDPNKLKIKAGNSTVTSEVVAGLATNFLPSSFKMEPEMDVDEVEEYIEENSDIKPSLKQEASVATQNPLGSQSKHWKCGQCKLVFESGPELLKHLEWIKRAKIKCIPCHVVFEDRAELLQHRKTEHPNDFLSLKFEPNSDVIDEPEQREEKVYLPNEIGEYVCDVCDRAFKDKEMLLKHLSCHIEEKPHECLECGKKFTKANQLKEHRKRHFEEGNYECQFCNKKFFSPNKLREHIRIHTGEAPLKCNVCGKGFKRHSNLSEHKKIHEVREVKPAKELFCQCGKVFKTQRDLDWHKEAEHEKVPKKCTYCLEVFVHSSSLTRHIRMKHEGNFMPEGKKTNNYARCPICSQVFYKTSINKHIRVKHQGQKPYSCEICKKEFVAKCNLDNHMWQHKNNRQRPFKCQLCNKAYLREALLEQHMRSHKGIKPFVCNECGLQFTVKSNWQRHVAEHSGNRNYECPHCHKKFSRSYYLTDHLKVHSREKPYICGICGKTAATRSNYNSHLRTHITREPVNSEV